MDTESDGDAGDEIGKMGDRSGCREIDTTIKTP